MFKDKIYWYLMPPFLIAGVLLILFLPVEYRLYSLLAAVLFWIVYYLIRFILKRTQGSSD